MSNERVRWFTEAAYGMFIHWGLFSVHKRGECFMSYTQMPVEEYARATENFRPRPGFAVQWARLAKRAGMKYAVFTTKHEDGFCNFDSALTTYNSTQHGACRDYVREYIEAFRAEGIRIGLYHAPNDLYHVQPRITAANPIRTPEKAQEQKQLFHGFIRELLSNYGKIDLLWIDGACPAKQADEFYTLARELQPEIVINDRAGQGGDFKTPENTMTAAEPGQAWELCNTINDSWGYHEYDHNYKTINQLIFMLVNCVVHGGNLLLNIAPRPDGTVPTEQVQRLEAVGRWLEVNGESVYGVTRLPMLYTSNGRITRKGRTLYLHCFYWAGSSLAIANLNDEVLGGGKVGSSVLKARLLATGEPVDARWEGTRLILDGMPQEALDSADTVIAVEVL